uniref:Adenosine 3'-phospho 5'-phosphosulfate transporter 2 n=1 Tax=Panagrellus redivivus TaxID=6233 RepID=A0A7E5A0V5_PANRE
MKEVDIGDSKLMSGPTEGEGQDFRMLPSTRQDVAPQRVYLLGFNITHWPSTAQFLILSFAVFFFYIGYGYMQELMFRLDGMRPYGWYLTFIQFLFYTIFSYFEMASSSSGVVRHIPIKVYLQLAFYTVATMGLSNAAIGYLNYPTQVIFKCCKLIPVLIGGIIIQGKRYGWLDGLSASLMSFGLILFSLADSQVSPNFDPRGYIMILGALVADAVIGNVQEKSMKKFGAQNTEVVFYSYSIGSIYIFIFLLLKWELFDAMSFFWNHPRETYGYGVIFSVLGYVGVNVVLTLVRTTGALTAVTVTTMRKAVTIILSFVFFEKPFTSTYLWAGLVVLIAIYVNLYNKNKTKWDGYMAQYFQKRQYLPTMKVSGI